MRLPWNDHIPLIGLIYDGVCLDYMSFSLPIQRFSYHLKRTGK